MATNFGFKAVSIPHEHIFVSYNRYDSEVIAPIVKLIHDRYTVWYDEGLIPGKEWEKAIIEQVCCCKMAVFFISKDLLERDKSYVCDECRFVEENCNFKLCVWLDDLSNVDERKLSNGMRTLWESLKEMPVVSVYDKETVEEKAAAIIAAMDEVLKKTEAGPNAADTDSNAKPKPEPKPEPGPKFESNPGVSSTVEASYESLTYIEKIKYFVKSIGKSNTLAPVEIIKLFVPVIVIIAVLGIGAGFGINLINNKTDIDTNTNINTNKYNNSLYEGYPKKIYFNADFLDCEYDQYGEIMSQEVVDYITKQEFDFFDNLDNEFYVLNDAAQSAINKNNVIKPLTLGNVSGWHYDVAGDYFDVVQESSGRTVRVDSNTRRLMGIRLLYAQDDFLIFSEIRSFESLYSDTNFKFKTIVYIANTATESVTVLTTYEGTDDPVLFLNDGWIYCVDNERLMRYKTDATESESIVYFENICRGSTSADYDELSVEILGLEF